MIDCIKISLTAKACPMGATRGPVNDVGRRLLAVGRYVGHPAQASFARYLGLSSSQRLGNVVRGSALGRDLAFLIVSKVPGLTTDWLWHGKTHGMPFELVIQLDRHLDALSERFGPEAS